MRFSLAALAIAVSFGPLAAADSVPKLVEGLASPDFRERESASRALEALGEPAFLALRKAAQSHADPEVVRRAGEIAVRIAKKINDEKTLSPTLVELAFDDKPLGEVLEALEKQTGYLIAMTDATVRHKLISVATPGKVAFWAAVEMICEAAGVDLVLPSEMGSANAVPLGRPINPFPTPPGARLVPTTPASTAILLRPHSGDRCKSYVRGAVLVLTVVAPHAMYSAHSKDTLPVLLVAMPEPKLKWERVVSIGIAKATDDQGRELVALSSIGSNPAVAPMTPFRGGNVVVGPNGVVMIPGRGMADPTISNGFHPQPTQGIARLKVGPDPTKSLGTFRGTIRGAVRTAPEVLSAVGKHEATANPPPVSGPHGVVLKASPFVASATNPDIFETDVTVSYSTSEVQLADANGSPLPQETIVMQGAGRMIVRRSFSSSSNADRGRTETQIGGLSALDSAGRPFFLAASGYRRQMDGMGAVTDSLKLIIKPSDKTVGKPTVVTFTATRAKTVDVPFELTGVPVAAGLGSVSK